MVSRALKAPLLKSLTMRRKSLLSLVGMQLWSSREMLVIALMKILNFLLSSILGSS